jgi:hypothetical protein
MNKNYKDYWRLVANRKEIKPEHAAHYCLLKALSAKSNNKVEIAQALLRRAFTPVTNKNELANGRFQYDTLGRTLRHCGSQHGFFGFDKSIFLDDEEGVAAYDNLLNELQKLNFAKTEPEYVFIFVRQDISNEQQAVQAAHATYKAGAIFKPENPDETYFVLIGVPDEAGLHVVKEEVESKGFSTVVFNEPDLSNTDTALATEPMKAYQKRFLKHHRKLAFEGPR